MEFKPEQLSGEQIYAGRQLFGIPAVFVLGVARLDQLPLTDMPEVAFAGRSNVGKSSLINALTGQKGLAKTSNTPGRTQQLNYFVKFLTRFFHIINCIFRTHSSIAAL